LHAWSCVQARALIKSTCDCSEKAFKYLFVMLLLIGCCGLENVVQNPLLRVIFFVALYGLSRGAGVGTKGEGSFS